MGVYFRWDDGMRVFASTLGPPAIYFLVIWFSFFFKNK